MPNVMNIRSVGDEVFHVDERADMTKLTVASRNFANTANNQQYNWKSAVDSFCTLRLFVNSFEANNMTTKQPCYLTNNVLLTATT